MYSQSIRVTRPEHRSDFRLGFLFHVLAVDFQQAVSLEDPAFPRCQSSWNLFPEEVEMYEYVR